MTEKMKNLMIRSLTGVIFVALLVAGFLHGILSFAILFAVITGLSLWEFSTIANMQEGVRINTFLNTVAGIFLFLGFFAFCSNQTSAGIFIPYLITLIYILISELYLKNKYPLQNWAFSMMGQLYVALPFSLLNILAFSHHSEYGSESITYNGFLPLSVFIILWLTDSGAYCFGSLFGKRKLFPSISPKKSWEGFIGGLAVAAASSQLLAYDASLTRMGWLGLALVVAVFGTWGDLVESLIKRQIGIKDSGKILPGHGGMLDRFDSSLMAIPAAVIYIYTLTVL